MISCHTNGRSSDELAPESLKIWIQFVEIVFVPMRHSHEIGTLAIYCHFQDPDRD